MPFYTTAAYAERLALVNTLIPEFPIILADFVNVLLALANQLLLGKPLKMESTPFGKPEVLVIRYVAEHTGSNDKVGVISIRMDPSVIGDPKRESTN